MASMVEATTRKALADMEPQELRQWLLERRKLLAHHKQFVRRYLNRRRVRHRGKQTYADRQYCRFQVLSDDLLELLESVITNIDQQMQHAANEKESTS